MSKEIGSREKYFWNTMGSFANAVSSLVLSVIVNRLMGETSGGVFAFAYSNAQLMLTVGEFEVRQYQVTDIREKSSFRTYRQLRFLTCSLMLACTAGYILLNRASLSEEACVMIFLLSVFKLIEAYADVYAGRLQQKDRIDLSGKIFFVRITASTAAFAVVLWRLRNLVVASASMVFTSFALFFLYDRQYAKPEKKMEGTTSWGEILRLTWNVFPLFLQAFSLMYVNNAPKYAINRVCNEEVQNLYNILIMPTFTVNLFSMVIFRPLLLDIARTWDNHDFAGFRRIIIQVTAIIAGLTAAILAGTWLFGTQILSLLYGIDLAEQRGNLFAAMMVGGLCALSKFLYNVITAIRYHKLLAIGYGASFLCALLTAQPLVSRYGIQGGIAAYALSMGVLCVIYLGIFLLAYAEKAREH